ncbi:MAG: DMT family transporter [Rhodococcus sp. (in: high G+C Gram-positive bacteria)]|uniref:DMT family transporter n=1 Tax=Rhodococcus sp. TaxID=1831 RepID=UPI003BB549A3
MSDSLLAALLAVGAALCIAVGTVVRQRAAAAVPDADSRMLGPISSLVRNPTWWLGTAAGAAGYVLQAAALALGSLLLVQPMLVLSLLFALPLSARFAGRRVGAREWWWAATLTTSVAVLVVVGDPQPGEPRPELQHWIVLTLLGVPALALCLFEAGRRTRPTRALLLGLAAGSLFGVAAVLTKSVVHLVLLGAREAVLSIDLYALIAVFAVATSVQQSAFHAGDLRTSLPATTVVEPMVAALLGFAVLGEYLDADRTHIAVLVGALAAMVAATIALARTAADSDPAAVTANEPP